MGVCRPLHAWRLNGEMRATTALLLVAVLGCSVQAIKIRGTRRKYIVDKPIISLTPAQKEYFVRLLWLIKHPNNGPLPNLEYNDAEIRDKIANGGFYYDKHDYDQSNNKNKTNGNNSRSKYNETGSYVVQSQEKNVPSRSNELPGPYVTHSDGYNSFSRENEKKSYENYVPIRSNESQDPYVIHSDKHNNYFRENEIKKHEKNVPSKSNELPGPYVIHSNEHSGYSSENDIKKYENNSQSRSNELPGPYVVHSDEYNSYSREIEVPSRSNEIQGPYATHSDEHNSYSRENEINSHENNVPSRSNELSGPYVVQSDAHNIYSRENEVKSHENNFPSRSNELPGPYVVQSDEHNSYSRENEVKSHENNVPSRSNELPGPYVVHNDEYNSYSRENDVNSHENNVPSRSNELPGPYVVHSDEYNSYSRENEIKNHENNDQSRSNEHTWPGPYIEPSAEYSDSNQNEKSYENNDKYTNNTPIEQSSESSHQSESSDIQSSQAVKSEEDNNSSTNDFSEEVLPPNDKNKDHPYDVNQPDEQGSSKENKVREIIEDVLNEHKGHQYNENYIIHKIKEYLKRKHERESKHHCEKCHRRPQRPSSPSESPKFIIQADRSLKTLRIIPAPRLTSLVIKMCDNSNTKLHVWKGIAKHLGLDKDYRISNINEVDRLFKIIKEFVALSKDENFLKLPLGRILATIHDNLSAEIDEKSIVVNKNEDNYSENSLREPGDFAVETSLERGEIPPESLSSFLKYIFENQEDNSDSSEEAANSSSLISDEDDPRQRKKLVKKHSSAEQSSDFSSSDEFNNDRRISEDKIVDSAESSFVSSDSDDENVSQDEGLPDSTVDEKTNSSTLLPYSPNPDISDIYSSDNYPNSLNPDDGNFNRSLVTRSPVDHNEKQPVVDSIADSGINSSDILPYSLKPNVDNLSTGNSFKEVSYDLQNSDDVSELPFPNDSKAQADSPNSQSSSDLSPQENNSDDSFSVEDSQDISSTPSYPVFSEDPVSSDQKPSSNESSDSSSNSDLYPHENYSEDSFSVDNSLDISSTPSHSDSSEDPVSPDQKPSSNESSDSSSSSDLYPHGNNSEDSFSVDDSLEISSTPSYPDSSEDPVSSIESSDNSDDLFNHLIHSLGKDVSKFIMPFLGKLSHCKNPVHEELLQKLRDILEVLRNADCF